MRSDPPPAVQMREDPYPEMVASLFDTRMPAAIMSALFVVVAGVVTIRSLDRWLAVLLLAGVVASAARLAVLFAGHRLINAGPLTSAAARTIERRFGASYVAFAAVFGCFAARALALPLAPLHLPVGILVVGYAAGVVATTSLRPAIALPSLLLSVPPAAAAIAMGGDLEHLASAVSLVALLAGGLRSLSRRYRIQTTRLAESRASATLARRDHLTGVANRLALTEAVGTWRKARGASLAVHYLDLDDFKLVNDHLGHAAGDALLREVAARLQKEVGDPNMVARLGGDEFAVVETDVTSAPQVAEQALRIEHCLAKSFEVDGRPVHIGVSVGSSWVSEGGELNVILKDADDALRARKLERKRHRFENEPSRLDATGIRLAASLPL